MRAETVLSGDLEIRHLPLDILQTLAKSLDIDDQWTTFAKKIPVSELDPTPLYSAQHLHIIKHSRDGPTITLLNDWGTHGRKRPTVNDLIQLLVKSDFHRIADYLSVDILGGEPVPKNYKSTTVELNQFSLEMKNINGVYKSPKIKDQNPMDELLNSFSRSLELTDEQDWENSGVNYELIFREESSHLPQLTYDYVGKITNNFNELKYTEGGNKVGAGAFSDVFFAVYDDQKTAIKRSKKIFEKQFYKEVHILSKYQHKNFLKLLAVSISDEWLCLVYDFMVNGSLQDRLARLNNTSPIPWETRLSIASDVAEGLDCLHSNGFIHRDIKSANVLLDSSWTAKLGDFGIAHKGPNLSEETSLETKRVVGTSVYMPREAFNGIITFKLDTFSFGVVLLELLTGKKPYDPVTKDDLVSQVAERCSESGQIDSLLDPLAGDWDIEVANNIYHLSNKCLQSSRIFRPTMKEVMDQLQTYVDKVRQSSK